MKHWFSDLYANVDAMRLDEFVAGLAPDVEVVVGNNPAMHGRQAAKDGIAYFWSTINGIKHHLVNVVESNGLTFLEANVEYLRKDGKSVTIPAVTVLERRGDLVKSLRIYFDVAPVYANGHTELRRRIQDLGAYMLGSLRRLLSARTESPWKRVGGWECVVQSP